MRVCEFSYFITYVLGDYLLDCSIRNNHQKNQFFATDNRFSEINDFNFSRNSTVPCKPTEACLTETQNTSSQKLIHTLCTRETNWYWPTFDVMLLIITWMVFTVQHNKYVLKIIYANQGCGLSLNISVLRWSQDSSRSHLGNKWQRLSLVSVSAIYGFCHMLFPVTRCLGCAWHPWSRLHVIAPYKLTLYVIIINGRENKCTIAIIIMCKRILTFL